MDASEIQQYKDALLALQQELELQQKDATDDKPVQLDGTIGRVSRAEALLMQQQAKEVGKRRDERLVRIQSALMRIGQGSYGLCVRCRNEIDRDRLDAYPDSVLCIRCANRAK